MTPSQLGQGCVDTKDYKRKNEPMIQRLQYLCDKVDSQSYSTSGDCCSQLALLAISLKN
jgi:hypothetical protein